MNKIIPCILITFALSTSSAAPVGKGSVNAIVQGFDSETVMLLTSSGQRIKVSKTDVQSKSKDFKVGQKVKYLIH